MTGDGYAVLDAAGAPITLADGLVAASSDGTLTVLFKRGYQNLPSRPHKVVEPAA